MENYEEFFRFVEKDSIKLIFSRRGQDWADLYPDSLRIRVWKDRVIQSLGWESFLRENGHMSTLFEVEYVLSVSDLEQLELLDYEISFPPNELMQSITMFPPYEEVIQKYPAIVGKITHHD